MPEAQHLADTLVAMFAYADHGVLTPFTAAIAGLTAEQAAADPGHGLHSVWAVVNHVRFWHEVPLLQLREQPVDYRALGAKDGWPPVPDDPSEADWQSAVAGITALNREVAGLVKGLTEAQLAEPIVAGCVTRWQVIQALIVHNGYHTCSVISARRVLGLWNA
jgi:hypothetical protein